MGEHTEHAIVKYIQELEVWGRASQAAQEALLNHLKAVDERLDALEGRVAAVDNSYSSLRPGEPWAS